MAAINGEKKTMYCKVKTSKLISYCFCNIICIFNKIDLVDNKIILPYINDLKSFKKIQDFFLISSKFNLGIDDFLISLLNKAKLNKWICNSTICITV